MDPKQKKDLKVTFSQYRNLRFAYLTSPASFGMICRDQGIAKKDQKVLIASFKANGFVPQKSLTRA